MTAIFSRPQCVNRPHSRPWWRHQMKTFSALLALCAGNSPVPGEFPAQRPVTRSFDVSLICARINGWVNNGEAGDLRRHRVHYDVIVMHHGNPKHEYNQKKYYGPNKTTLTVCTFYGMYFVLVDLLCLGGYITHLYNHVKYMLVLLFAYGCISLQYIYAPIWVLLSG